MKLLDRREQKNQVQKRESYTYRDIEPVIIDLLTK